MKFTTQRCEHNICTSTGHYRPLDIQIDVRYIGFADSQIEKGVYWDLQTARLRYGYIGSADSQIDIGVYRICIQPDLHMDISESSLLLLQVKNKFL
jgi:hypothetical protein